MSAMNVAGLRGRWRIALDTATSLAIIAAAATVVWSSFARPYSDRPKPLTLPLPSEPVAVSGLPTRGQSSAKAAIIEYSDFQCPFCSRFAAETQPLIQKEYLDTGRAIFVFRHLPLQIHAFSEAAARGAVCAAEEGKFWEMHDALFAMKGVLGPTSVQTLAAQLGIHGSRFDACLATRSAAVVQRDVDTARAVNATGTPTFLVGKVLSDGRIKVTASITGNQPISVFQQALEGALK